MFADSIPRGIKMENIDSKIKERGRGRGIHPKLFPSAKPKQLNHHIKLTLEENKYDGGIPAFFYKQQLL